MTFGARPFGTFSKEHKMWPHRSVVASVLICAVAFIASAAEAKTLSEENLIKLIELRIDPATKSIRGSNKITFKAVEDFTKMQVDLWSNLPISKIE